MVGFLPGLTFAEYRKMGLAKETLFREIAANQLKPMPGIERFLEWSEANKIGRVLVTNAPRPNVDFLMDTLKLSKWFPPDRQILSDDLDNAKPHPEPYLKGLERLGIAADEGLAFEDSRAGARSAVAARIPTAGLMTTLTPGV